MLRIMMWIVISNTVLLDSIPLSVPIIINLNPERKRKSQKDIKRGISMRKYFPCSFQLTKWTQFQRFYNMYASIHWAREMQKIFKRKRWKRQVISSISNELNSNNCLCYVRSRIRVIDDVCNRMLTNLKTMAAGTCGLFGCSYKFE